MKKENAFKKHKKAVIVIIALLVLSNLFRLIDDLRNDTQFFIMSLVSLILLFFIIFAVYYCFIQVFTKSCSKCEKLIKKRAEYCPKCGTKQEDKKINERRKETN